MVTDTVIKLLEAVERNMGRSGRSLKKWAKYDDSDDMHKVQLVCLESEPQAIDSDPGCLERTVSSSKLLEQLASYSSYANGFTGMLLRSVKFILFCCLTGASPATKPSTFKWPANEKSRRFAKHPNTEASHQSAQFLLSPTSVTA